jgi:hypothetical protein
MSKNDNTRSALRAALKQEDAALTERLAAATQTPASAADPAEAPMRSAASAAALAKAVKTKAAPAKLTAKPKAAKAVRKLAAATAPDISTAVDEVSSAAAKNKAAPKPGPKAVPAAAPAAESAAAKKKMKPAADAGRKDKPEKIVRDSFSLPTSEHARIKALRVELGKAGRLASKSEVLRAGLNLLGDRSTAEVSALLDALPPMAKGKRSKKH